MGSKKNKSDLSLFGNSALLNRNRIYNLGIRKKPAELFRKDLISAMKLPDSDQLNPEDYLTIQDPWKEEWEKGVQVPVNPDALAPDASVRLIPESERIKHPLNTSSDDENKDASHNQLPNKHHSTSSSPSTHPQHHHHHQHHYQHHHQHQSQVTQFKMPKKLLKFEPERDEICSRYEIDLTDLCWLESISEADVVIREDFFEEVMNELEVQCSTNMKAKHVGIEFDDHIVCDICRSPDAEDGNEMVFCDSCNICVHQACYGITVIPDDEWLCRPCREGKKSVTCTLCPNLGGAFKPTSSGNSWAHVACALWIPEVSIGNVTTMEPVTKIKSIPASRWNLVCSICNVKTGAPIQCSYKTCKTAYHVTCAFNEKLKMKAIVDDESNGGVKLKSYCQRHSDEAKPLLNDSDDESGNLNANCDEKNKSTKSTHHQEFEIASQAAVESEKNNRFWMYIDINEINQMLVPRFQEKYKDMSNKTILFHVDIIQQYWKLKRTSNFGMPLIKVVTHDTIEEIQMAHRSDILKLRVNLERIRNLSYMIIRREKLKRTWLQSHRSLIEKALGYALGIDDLSEHLNNVKDEPKESTAIACNILTSSSSKASPCKSSVTSPAKGASLNNNLTTLTFIPSETSSLVKNIINSSVIYENFNETQVEIDKARVKRIMKELNRLTKINQLRRRIPNPYVKEYSSSKCFKSNNNCNSIEDHKTPSTCHSFRNTDESDEESIFEPKVTRSRHTSMENKGHLHHTLNGAGILTSPGHKGSSSTTATTTAAMSSSTPVKIKSEPNTSPHRSTSPTYLQKHSHQLQQLNNQNVNCKSPTTHHHHHHHHHQQQHSHHSHNSSSNRSHGQESPSHQASSSSPNCKKLTRSSVNNECKKYNGLRSNDLQSTEESGLFKKFF